MKFIIASGFMLFLGLGIAEAQYQNIVIKDKSGYEQLVPLVNLHKVTFANDNMVVNYIGDSTKSHPLESISKLYFRTTTSSVEEVEYEYTIFPNPTLESISVKGIEKYPAVCTIYNMSGEKIKTVVLASESDAIQTHDLAVGVYFIKIDNQIRKFEKYEK